MTLNGEKFLFSSLTSQNPNFSTMLPLLKSAVLRRPLLRLRPFSAVGAEAPSHPRPLPSPHVLRLVDDIASLSQSQISELCRILIQKTGQEPPTVAVIGAGAGGGLNTGASAAGGPTAGAKEEKKEEKTVFELKLEGFDAASKIKVIKEVRGFTDLGLKEAKELVEKAPVVIKGGFSKEEGEKIVDKMKAVGAKVVLE